MKKIITMLSALIFCLSVCGCERIDTAYISDYYGEYSLELPFELEESNYAGSSIYFSAEYSLEQMCVLINEAGYSADLYKTNSSSAILITITNDPYSYYFVIRSNESSDYCKYTFTNCALSFEAVNSPPSNEAAKLCRYSILAPVHIMSDKKSISNDRISFEVYDSFDYIASFYTASGKNDFIIDESEKTITFRCKGKADLYFAESDITMHYIEATDKCRLELEITPVSRTT